MPTCLKFVPHPNTPSPHLSHCRDRWSDHARSIDAQQASQMVFVHNQILCHEVVRLRHELELVSDPESSSSRQDSCAASSPGSHWLSSSPDDETSHEPAGFALIGHHGTNQVEEAPAQGANYRSSDACWRSTSLASVADGCPPAPVSPLQYSSSEIDSLGSRGGEGKVSCHWMESSSEEGAAFAAAKATVLFASPTPQLSRDYESLSDWV